MVGRDLEGSICEGGLGLLTCDRGGKGIGWSQKKVWRGRGRSMGSHTDGGLVAQSRSLGWKLLLTRPICGLGLLKVQCRGSNMDR